ncbi:MAG: tol-pal system protein YbgF, partial [Pseudomonadota bacterium]
MRATRWLTIGIALVTAACATVPPEEDPVVLKLNELERRIVAMERVVQNDSLVNLVTTLESLRQDVSQLRGQVETLTFESESASERQRELYLDLDTRIQALEQGRGAVAGGDGVQAGELPVPGGSDQGNYRAAFELLKEGRYDQASNAFQQFLVAYPDSELADNAQYWLAESFYVSQKFAEALPAFQRVVDEHPDSAKVPDALLKIGYCNYELGNWNDARGALVRVESEYSDTTAARL